MNALMKKEPAVIIGLAVGLLTAATTAIAQATVDGQVNYVVALVAGLPLVVGVLVRFGVFSPKSVDEIREALAPVAAADINIVVSGQVVDVDNLAKAIRDAIDRGEAE